MSKPVRYFDDFTVGEKVPLGSFELSEDEIVEFAARYDPQPFHVDAEAARSTDFGGIIASGWQTAACVMRLMVDGFISSEASLGSPGMDELRWTRPVRPGVAYSASVVIEETRPSRSKPDRGSVRTRIELTDPDGGLVYTAKGIGIYRKRNP